MERREGKQDVMDPFSIRLKTADDKAAVKGKGSQSRFHSFIEE